MAETSMTAKRLLKRKGIVDRAPDNGNSISFICKNSACQATMCKDDEFCKRCSCHICMKFDDNKDPSLWFVCTSEAGDEESCGLSSHLECALQSGKMGKNGQGQSMNLDGSLCCAFCGKVSLMLECWKKQLIIAKDARRVDVLWDRVSLSYRLLEGTLKFQELHQVVKDAMTMLEKELGPVREASGKVSRGGIVSRLPVASEVQQLCVRAIEKVDEWLAAVSGTNLHQRGNPDSKVPKKWRSHSSVELDLNVEAMPDLNEEMTPYCIDNKKISLRSDGSGVSTYGDMPAVNSRGGLCRERALISIEDANKRGTMLNNSPLDISKMPGNLEFNFDHCVKVICKLESDGHIQKEFRTKFLTWFSLRSTDHEKRVVKTFIQYIDDSSSLAGQLVHTFSDLVNFKKPHSGV